MGASMKHISWIGFLLLNATVAVHHAVADASNLLVIRLGPGTTEIPYCRAEWPVGLRAYLWSILIDSDGDPLTGDAQGYDRQVSLEHWNACSEYGSFTHPMEWSQSSVWRFNAGTNTWQASTIPPPQVHSLGTHTELSFLISSRLLQGTGADSRISVLAFYRPYAGATYRVDNIQRFRFGDHSVFPGVATRDDPAGDVTGCPGCNPIAVFEPLVDLHGVDIWFDGILFSGFD